MLRQTRQHGLLVVLADVCRDTAEEGVAAGVFGHAADVLADEQHGSAAVGREEAVTVVRLRRAAVDDGYEVVSDDDAVLVFPLGVLADTCLLDDLHGDIVR